MSYDQIKEAMFRFFRKPSMPTVDARRQFYERTQRSDENCFLYAAELSKLARQAWPDLDSDALKKFVLDQFKNGMRSQAIRDHLRFRKFYSLDHLLEEVDEMENSSSLITFTNQVSANNYFNEPPPREWKDQNFPS
ncbi:unnamed protein product [Brachionus calyciflorus]|uniref:Retrotransposon gag domain-containing protein n=1 Tax=Brachionus calyciflorus TaxID=104777 RepID=A0A814PQ78_9BILA|nr:unnamed protein product [Brachionus calyciflorus]